MPVNQRLGSALAASLCILGLSAGVAAAQERALTLVYAFPDQLPNTELCKEIVADLNERLDGTLEIEVLPFNTIPALQEAQAVRQGRIDMACTSSAYYSRIMPENAVLWTSNKTAAEVREAGGQQILDELTQEHAGLALLGWFPAGGFRFYFSEEPKFTDEGLPDFSGLTVRDVPVFSPLIDELGGAKHSLPPSEVYAALETGIVEGAPWTIGDLDSMGWDQFLKYTITPSFFQTDNVMIMNANVWNELDHETQATIKETLQGYEEPYRQRIRELDDASDARYPELGVTAVEIPNNEAFQALAIDLAYEQMRQRLEEAGRSTDHTEDLRSAFVE